MTNNVPMYNTNYCIHGIPCRKPCAWQVTWIGTKSALPDIDGTCASH